MDELDSYSRTVSTVAAALGPAVAAVTAGRGGGSAVVLDDRTLVTNAHVVDDHRAVRLAFADGSEIPADVLGTDALSDLAVLGTAGDLPTPATLGDADGLVVGQLVVAVGNPPVLRGEAMVDVFAVPTELVER